MHTQKISISLPLQQYEFIEYYQAEHQYKTRSEVISEALYLLQMAQLETCYREANKEADITIDSTLTDGLDDETW